MSGYNVHVRADHKYELKVYYAFSGDSAQYMKKKKNIV